jgi:hypothetical protein
MKRLLGLSLVAGILFVSCQKDEILTPTAEDNSLYETQTSFEGLSHGDVIPNSYIVVFKETPDLKNVESKYETMKSSYERDFAKNDKFLQELHMKKMDSFRVEYERTLTDLNIPEESIENVYTGSVFGISAKLSDKDVRMLEKDARVDYIEPNRYIELSYRLEEDTEGLDGAKAQTIPWGISRVGAAVYTGSRVAWVVDTGIQYNHPDLNVYTSACRSFVSGESYNDGNGHGTHVAGTIAAIHNTYGVVGVAAGARVVAVKVLSNQGGGSYAGIISGIDYVRSVASSGDVANFSLGGPASTALDNAVINLSNRGVWCVIAAGNDYRNANNYSPARVNGTYIYTVSSHDSNNRFSTFSNWANPPIDWCAPGTSIYSTWIGSSYRTISGTSMAAPHVAGIRLMGAPRVRGYVTNDPDGNPDRMAQR